MNSQQQRRLLRDCSAITVPNGVSITLHKGCKVMITQALGDNYTVNSQGQLYRIAGKDGDALGQSIKKIPQVAENSDPQDINFRQLFAQIKTCYDPEIPVNIVDLGLIYDVNCYQLIDGRNLLRITMTLTSAGCSMGSVLTEEVKSKCLNIANIDKVEVSLVFDPPWSYELISDAAKLQLGLL